MDPDLSLVLGLVIGAFSIPSILSAISDGRGPRASALTILVACGLIFYALQMKPGGYELDKLPDVFVRVVRGFV